MDTTAHELPQYRKGRVECTAEELSDWCERIEEEQEDFRPGYQVRAPRRIFPPCLGCGAPVRPSVGLGGAFAISTPPGEQPGPVTVTKVVFGPCGCELRVWVPPILDHVPAGTRLGHGVWVVLDGLVLGRSKEEVFEDKVLMEVVAGKLKVRPQVILLLTPAEVAEHQIPRRIADDERLLVAATLEGIPDETTHIVLRPATADVPGFPADLNGHRVERGGSYRGLYFYVMLEGAGYGHAMRTGRVEVGEDGCAAEVYSVSRMR